jgi:hypothetical protein
MQVFKMGRLCKIINDKCYCDIHGIRGANGGGIGRHKSRYGLGLKYCSRCCVFWNIHDYYCPCCSTRLRLKPRGKKLIINGGTDKT